MHKLIDIPEGINVIEIRKELCKFLSRTKKISKPNKCILCGKPQTSLCNSHSVPQLVLKNIAENGKVLQASALMGIDFIDIEVGVKSSGTFHFICNDCDGKFFQDYENKENLKLRPTDKILSEIAVKNILLQLSKREQEKVLYRELQREFNAYNNLVDLEDISRLDIRDYTEELQFHKNIAEKNVDNGYQILYWKVVPYNVPIAIQSAIALSKDIEGNKINNVFNMSEDVRMQFMHLAILPLKEGSVILAFYHKRDKLYKKLRHQINCLSEQKVLQYLNYLIFAHTENYFISKTIQSTIELDDKLVKLGQENNDNPNLGFLGLDNYFGIGYKPINMEEIPNFLDSDWAII